MKTPAVYLAELKALTGAASDRATGLRFGWSRAATTNYKTNSKAFSNFHCLLIAQALNIPVIQVIADMELLREKVPERRALWLKYATPPTSAQESENHTEGNNLSLSK
jgi:hypothetical protein